jgi:rhodanese-related sulfurtransferase
MITPQSPAMPDLEITPAQLQQRLAASALQLVDVRRDEEVALGTLAGAIHIPLHHLPELWHQLNPQLPTVTLCHHGVRSLQAAGLLLANGFVHVQSLKGGLDAWALQIDPNFPRY